MSDKLIKHVAVDIIAITSMWALLNNPYMANAYTFKFYLNSYHCHLNYSPTYSTIFGLGLSTIVLLKYL